MQGGLADPDVRSELARQSTRDHDLPPILQKQPPARLMSGLDGKAFLKDIDTKFDGQDKLINHLMTQIGQLDVKVQSLERNNAQLGNEAREKEIKMQSSFKLANDESSFGL